MDFDHRDPKTKVGSIASLQNKRLKLVYEELPKCDLLCANCHRLRTWRRLHAETGELFVTSRFKDIAQPEAKEVGPEQSVSAQPQSDTSSEEAAEGC